MPPDMAVERPRTPQHQPIATDIIVFQPRASAMASGCTSASASAPVMCQSGCLPVDCAHGWRGTLACLLLSSTGEGCCAAPS